MQNIEVLILGTGMMAEIVPRHIRGAGGEVTGILGWTRKELDGYLERNRRFLPNLNDDLTGTFDDYPKMLEMKGSPFNMVAPLIPNHLHVPFGIQAVRAGKHLLSEKPLATNTVDARKLFNEVMKSSVVAQINSQYRHHRVLNRDLKDIFGRGELGKPREISLEYVEGWQANVDDQRGWRLYKEFTGPGMTICDLFSHEAQTLFHIFGGSFVDFLGIRENLHPVRYVLKNWEGTTHKGDDIPRYNEHPELYKEINMLNPLVLGDDRIKASGELVADNFRVPVSFYASQVDRGKNDFYMKIKFERGELLWRQRDPNYLEITRGGNHILVERIEAPSYCGGLPAGHPHGYGDAIYIGLVEMFDVIREGNPHRTKEYSKKNIGDAVKVVELMDKLGAAPLTRTGGHPYISIG